MAQIMCHQTKSMLFSTPRQSGTRQSPKLNITITNATATTAAPLLFTLCSDVGVDMSFEKQQKVFCRKIEPDFENKQ